MLYLLVCSPQIRSKPSEKGGKFLGRLMADEYRWVQKCHGKVRKKIQLKKFIAKIYKNQKYIINNDIEFYYLMFKLISVNLKTQQMLDNYTRCCWFLTKLLKKMQFKLMKKHDVNLQNSTIMIFSRFYENRLKKAQKMKWEHNLEKKMRKNILKKLNQ